jgi:hypothetical protein
MMANPNLQDVREWGKANGFNILDGNPILPKGLREAFVEAHRDSNDVDNGDEVTVIVPETKPKIPRRSVVDRARELTDKDRLKSKISKLKRPRISVDRIVGRGWEMLARIVQPVNLPIARVLEVQAPVAGLILDSIIKDTLFDKILQPMAQAEEKGEIAFALIGPPLLVGLIQAKPEMQAVLVPALKEALRVWIDVAGPKIEIVKKRDAEFQEHYGQDIDNMIAMFFRPPDDWQSDQHGTGESATNVTVNL